MPIKTNFFEHLAFFQFNAAPGPMLDLAGALAFQAVSTAVHLGLFDQLQAGPRALPDLVAALEANERGVVRLLEALQTLGYVDVSDGRYAASAMTQKWFSEDAGIDMVSAVTVWDRYLRELWPHAPQVIRSGKRPYDFYEYVAADPALSHAFQQMMVGNANLTGPDIIKKIALPDGATRLLDVGGGHGAFSIQFCQAYPGLTATIIDSAAALESARQNVADAGLAERIELVPGDLWQLDWGSSYDLVLLFNLLHHYDKETNQSLLRRARQALRRGGRVAILEQVEGNVNGSAANALVRLVALMYYLFADGRVYSLEELDGMLTGSGFGQIRAASLPKAPGNKLIMAVAS